MNYKVEKVNKMFLITVLVAMAASLLPISSFLPGYAARILFSEIILVLPGAVYLIAGRQNYARAMNLKKIRPATCGWLVLFTICVMPVMTLVNAISMLFVENTTTDTMSQVTGEQSWLFSMVLIAVLPAVFEESVYRGLFYQEYRKVAPVRGMLLSAFLFGIMHGNLNQFSYAFLMGIIFALVIEATDSILASMIMHMIINGSSVTLLAVYPKLMKFLTDAAGLEENSTELTEVIEQASTPDTLLSVIQTYLPIALFAGAFAVVIYMVMAAGEGRLEHVKGLFRRKKNASEESVLPQPEGDGVINALVEEAKTTRSGRLLTPPLIAGIIICVALMLINEFVPV